MGREPLRYTLQKGSTVFTRWVHGDAVPVTRRGRWTPALLVSFLVWAVVAPLHAQEDEEEDETPAVTLGAGLQTSFLHHQPAKGDSVDNFRLNSLRFYVNGQASDNISFMINTDINYGGTLFVCPEDGSCGAGFGNQGNEVQVLDAVAQIGISDKFNIWFGRRTSTVPSFPITGLSLATVCRTATRSSSRGAKTGQRIGASSARSSCLAERTTGRRRALAIAVLT